MTQANENDIKSENNIKNLHDNKPKDKSKKQIDDEKRKKWLEMQEQMKAEKNYRGMLCNAPESFGMVKLAIQGDRAIKNLRSGLYNTIFPETADPLFKTYNDNLVIFEAVIRKASIATGLIESYKCPDYISIIKASHTMTPEAQVILDRIENMVVKEPIKLKKVK